MKRKRFFSIVQAALATMMLFALPANAQTDGKWRQTIIVTTLDGTTMEYFLDNDTKVTIEKPNLVIETENVVLTYELESMKNVRYGKKFVTDGIHSTTLSDNQPFTLEDETLFFKDLPENTKIGIYTTDGKTIVSRQCGGDASLPLNNLTAGGYLGENKNESYKILKK